MKTLELKQNFFWTGVLDPDLDVFDIIMHTEFGTTYNSYLIKGSEKTAIFETAKAKFMDQYIDSLQSLTDIKDIDYIIVNHTEPDHAGSAARLIEMNPGIKLVGTGTAIRFIKEITNTDFVSITVKNGDTLSLGDKTLRFITAPNLHWPDTMYTYVEEDKTLITCDSFGSHYSFEDILHSRITDEEGYMRALKYYFDNILGPFKSYLLAGISKIKDLDIDMICPGHGPVLDDDPWKIVEICRQWSEEVSPNQKKTVVIPYVSAYGYTETLADKITEGIKASGDIDVKLYDMVYADEAEVRDGLYWADGILFGTPTILGEALEPIWNLTIGMFGGTHGGKIASAFGSYGWSGEGVPHIIERLRQLKMKVYGEGLRVKFKPSEAQLQEAYEFGYNFGLSVIEGKIVEPEPAPVGNQKWKCLVCGEVIEGPKPPESCPVCGVGPEQFVAVEEKEIGFVSQDTDSIVIIGGGIAGLSAADAIRKRNVLAPIEIISNEPVFCYNRPQLTKGLLSEFDAISFFNKQFEWYQENKIRLTLDTEVTAIDTQAKTLALSSGEERKYDKLIIASGAESNMPPTQGSDKSGVFVIRKLADANAIREKLDSVQDVVVVGAGVLGLEAAWELKRAGKNVTILDRGTGPMRKQLDGPASMKLLSAVNESGASLITQASVECFEGGDAVTGVKTKDGKVYPAQMVIVSAGNKPNIEIAAGAGITTDRFIEVDSKMRTSAPDVFACGDCAAVNGVSVGIYNQALEMGAVAGANATGDDVEYTPVIPSNAFSGFGISLFAIGDNGGKKDQAYKTLELSDGARKVYKKLYFLNGRFCGGILIGDVTASAELLKAYEKKLPIEELVSTI